MVTNREGFIPRSVFTETGPNRFETLASLEKRLAKVRGGQKKNPLTLILGRARARPTRKKHTNFSLLFLANPNSMLANNRTSHEPEVVPPRFDADFYTLKDAFRVRGGFYGSPPPVCVSPVVI